MEPTTSTQVDLIPVLRETLASLMMQVIELQAVNNALKAELMAVKSASQAETDSKKV